MVLMPRVWRRKYWGVHMRDRIKGSPEQCVVIVARIMPLRHEAIELWSWPANEIE